MIIRYTLFLVMLLTVNTLAVNYDRLDRVHPQIGQNGMVASQEEHASQVGLDILKKGGNAIDAAVAIGYALAVTHPQAGNLGGGGFMMIYSNKTKTVSAIDYREMAPSAAFEEMFLNSIGEVSPTKSRFSLWASGVPGTVAGLELARKQFGTKDRKTLIKPAIKLAEKGFIVSNELNQALAKSQKYMSSASQKVFFPNGKTVAAGTKLIQKDLAWSLKEIEKNGPSAFYTGKVSKKITSFMKENKGLINSKDLKNYQAIIRKPIYGTYKDYEIFSMPPPSSGGVHLIQMLNILEQFPLKKWGQNSANTIHALAESMKVAYADRSKYLGDPDFVSVNIEALTSKKYAKDIYHEIVTWGVKKSENIDAGIYLDTESSETTHYTVVDKWGNMVSNTYTLNFSFGSHIMVPGTGILLNNEMDDFSAKPGVPNAYGLLGSEANKIAPGKRMLSSMTPTIVLKNKAPFLATGSPGGARIITTVLQQILNIIEFEMNIAEATIAPRIHHQWYPDHIRYEDGLNNDTITKLESMGYELSQKNAMGSLQSIMIKDGKLLGTSDTRKASAKTLSY